MYGELYKLGIGEKKRDVVSGIVAGAAASILGEPFNRLKDPLSSGRWAEYKANYLPTIENPKPKLRKFLAPNFKELKYLSGWVPVGIGALKGGATFGAAFLTGGLIRRALEEKKANSKNNIKT
jgi:hypothetical protein